MVSPVQKELQITLPDIEGKLKDGSLQVFDTSTFTVGGENFTSAPVDLSFMDYTTDPATVVYQARLLRLSRMDTLQSPHSEALHTLHFVLMESQRTQTLLNKQ